MLICFGSSFELTIDQDGPWSHLLPWGLHSIYFHSIWIQFIHENPFAELELLCLMGRRTQGSHWRRQTPKFKRLISQFGAFSLQRNQSPHSFPANSLHKITLIFEINSSHCHSTNSELKGFKMYCNKYPKSFSTKILLFFLISFQVFSIFLFL